MAIYEKKYKVKELIKALENCDKKTLNIEELICLIGFDLIDLNHFYINNVRNRIRYKKEKRNWQE